MLCIVSGIFENLAVLFVETTYFLGEVFEIGQWQFWFLGRGYRTPTRAPSHRSFKWCAFKADVGWYPVPWYRYLLPRHRISRFEGTGFVKESYSTWLHRSIAYCVVPKCVAWALFTKTLFKSKNVHLKTGFKNLCDQNVFGPETVSAKTLSGRFQMHGF